MILGAGATEMPTSCPVELCLVRVVTYQLNNLGVVGVNVSGSVDTTNTTIE